METIKAKNIYYFYHINVIGGIETFFYQLAKKYKDKDLIIVYRTGEQKQIERLKEFVNVIQFNNQSFECEHAFFNFNIDIIDYIQAKKYFLVLHGDYKDMVNRGQISALPDHKKITNYIGVSQLACDSYSELTGHKCELCYNPFTKPETIKKLKLISATRLTREKGKNRMAKLSQLLDDANIPYEWTIFTNDTNEIKNPNIIYKKPTLDVVNYIAEADYLIQLSDNEGYCYSIVEALTLGVPVIVTPCPVFNEIGLENGKNCYFCDFDMENVPVQDIYNKIPKFTYKAKEDNWEKLLAPGESQYQKKKNTIVKVKATNLYKEKKIRDSELNRIPNPGEKWNTTQIRAEMLEEKDFVKILDI